MARPQKNTTAANLGFEHNAQELEAALILVRRAANGKLLTTDQGRGLVDIIARYTQTFLLLQRYDKGLLVEPKGESGAYYRLSARPWLPSGGSSRT